MMQRLARDFGAPMAVTLAIFLGAWWFLGGSTVIVLLILAVVELAFSFDNAVVNAKILAVLSPFWQRLFLSLGIVIAIFGVRLLLPLLLVSITGHMSLGGALHLAFRSPHTYARQLDRAHPAIASFGGAFLLMLVLHFFIEEREAQWLRVIERTFRRFAAWWLPMVCTFVVTAGLSLLPWNGHPSTTFQAGVLGMLAYAGMHGAIERLAHKFSLAEKTLIERVGMAAFVTFLYIEMLDASLSFDSVVGAFAVTSNIVLIALGLGIGALWVRSLTIFMVRRKVLSTYRYLEHGAHYAIGVLAVAMLVSVVFPTSDFILGLLCVGIIASAIISSREVVR